MISNMIVSRVGGFCGRFSNVSSRTSPTLRALSQVAAPSRSGPRQALSTSLGHLKNLAAEGQAVPVTSIRSLGPGTTRSFVSSPSVQHSAPAITDAQVKDLFTLWNDALSTLDPDTVAKRYASTSVLLPTVSDTPRTDYESIKSYFVNFLQKKPQGVILESNVIQGEDWCMDAGIYEFTMGATGDKVKARYTFVYTYEDGEWKIAHHHSSVMPEAFLG